MDVISIATFLFALAVLAAGVFDLVSYRIPNLIVLALLGLFVGLAALHYDSVDWVDHLLTGLGFFAVGVIFYALGQMGAGDVKLLGAIALWGGSGAALPLIFWISLCGFGVLLVLVALRVLALKRPQAEPVTRPLPRILKWGEGIPYGVPITIGTFVAIPYFQIWSWGM